MPFTAIFMYPNQEDTHFDESYYVKTHMPLVEAIWKKYGLQGWKIAKLPTTLNGSRSEYLIMTTLDWKSEEGLQEALRGSASAQLHADIPNFTNKHPITLAGANL
jgi:conserved hypothetical protein